MGLTESPKVAARGSALAGAGLLAGRGLTLFSQAALGALLDPDDWAIYATAVATTATLRALKDGAINDVLAASKSDAASIASAAMRLALRVNLLLASLIWVVALVIWSALDRGELALVIAWLGLTDIAGSGNAVKRGVLRSTFRFRPIAEATALQAAGRGLTAVVAAALGLGAISFVVAWPAVALLEGWWLGRHTNFSAPPGAHASAHHLARSSGWLMTVALGVALAASGDYLVLSIVGAGFLGAYFFAFQFIAQVSTLVTEAVSSSLLPYLAQTSDTPGHRLYVPTETIRLTVLLVGALSGLVALAFPVANRLIWSSQWSEATAAISILAAAVPCRAAFHVSRNELIATGHERAAALLIWALAIATAAAAIVGSLTTESPSEFSVVIAATLVATSVTAVALTGRVVHNRPATYGAAIAAPMLAIGMAWLVVLIADAGDAETLASLLVGATLFCGVLCGTGLLTLSRETRATLGAVARSRRGVRSS